MAPARYNNSEYRFYFGGNILSSARLVYFVVTGKYVATAPTAVPMGTSSTGR